MWVGWRVSAIRRRRARGSLGEVTAPQPQGKERAGKAGGRVCLLSLPAARRRLGFPLSLRVCVGAEMLHPPPGAEVMGGGD